MEGIFNNGTLPGFGQTCRWGVCVEGAEGAFEAVFIGYISILNGYVLVPNLMPGRGDRTLWVLICMC
jgi:hypothetical protein